MAKPIQSMNEQQRKVYFIGDNVLRHEGLNQTNLIQGHMHKNPTYEKKNHTLLFWNLISSILRNEASYLLNSEVIAEKEFA